MKPLKKCANGCDAPPSPPSKVICRECMDKITAKLKAWATFVFLCGNEWCSGPELFGLVEAESVPHDQRCPTCGWLAHPTDKTPHATGRLASGSNPDDDDRG